jgi:hypothetical protein
MILTSITMLAQCRLEGALTGIFGTPNTWAVDKTHHNGDVRCGHGLPIRSPRVEVADSSMREQSLRRGSRGWSDIAHGLVCCGTRDSFRTSRRDMP